MGGYSQNNLSVTCISGSFLMLCPKGGHFVKIWWLDYYRAGRSAGTLEKQPFCEMYFVEIWWLDYYREGKWVGTLEKQPFCEMYIQILFDVVSKKVSILLRFVDLTTAEQVSGWVLSKNLSVKCISGSFLMLCPKGGHFVKIWWLDYYRAGKWAGTLEKTTFL